MAIECYPASAARPKGYLTAMLLSVNVGTPRKVFYRGKPIHTAIWKTPVQGRVPVRGINLLGDDQGDRQVHGGPDKAVYSYSREDLDWWAGELDRPMENGVFGENLTISGIDVSGALVGERWRVGSVLFEVCQPRIPCFKLGIRMGNARFPKRFGLAGRPGAYLRIIEEGDVGAGDAVEIVYRPDHNISVAAASHIMMRDHPSAWRLLQAPRLPSFWLEWAREQVGISFP
jgi:MOSC domain-containing protein YiiM